MQQLTRLQLGCRVISQQRTAPELLQLVTSSCPALQHLHLCLQLHEPRELRALQQLTGLTHLGLACPSNAVAAELSSLSGIQLQTLTLDNYELCSTLSHVGLVHLTALQALKFLHVTQGMGSSLKRFCVHPQVGLAGECAVRQLACYSDQARAA